ncbi:MAG: hypothetical protein ACRCU9_03835 [Iodobacter sp.]
MDLLDFDQYSTFYFCLKYAVVIIPLQCSISVPTIRVLLHCALDKSVLILLQHAGYGAESHRSNRQRFFSVQKYQMQAGHGFAAFSVK